MKNDNYLRVLVISDLFPNPARPALGVFVERQCHYLQPFCDQVIIAPVRVFPHLRLWKPIFKPKVFLQNWVKWRKELQTIPDHCEVNGLPVYYPRYTSPPRWGLHGTWGYFAYPQISPLVAHLHRQHKFDLIHAHYATPCGTFALLARRWMNIPVVLSIHGSDLTYTIKQNRLSRNILINTFHQVDAILANSSKTAQTIINYGISSSKVVNVPLGANPETDLPIGNSPIVKDCFDLLTVGYLEKRKGHEFVIRALAELIHRGYKVHYTIVGDGSEGIYLKDLTYRLGMEEHVQFIGYKPHDQVWAYITQCDLFVMPSWDEAFGLVYAEAMWMGKTVIGCEGEGGPEDLKALGDCITLVKPRNVTSLRDAIQQLMDNPIRLRTMGKTGKRIVHEHYRWEKNAEITFDIYKIVLNKYLDFASTTKLDPDVDN